MKTQTRGETLRRILFVAVAVFALTASGAIDVSGIKLTVTGVAVTGQSEDLARIEDQRFQPPEKRIVVPSGKQAAAFRVHYDVPKNMTVSCVFAEINCGRKLVYGMRSCRSRNLQGTGVVTEGIQLKEEYGHNYNKGVLLKSVRLIVYLKEEGDDAGAQYVCDAPVNVLFAKDGDKKDGFDVLEPLPPPPATSTSLLDGWTDDLDAAKARAEKEGKLVLAYFFNSGKGPNGILDHGALGSKAFLEKVGKSCVLFMGELHPPYQSWKARRRDLPYWADLFGVSTIPGMAIVHPDGKGLALVDRKGGEGGVAGYLANVEAALTKAREIIVNKTVKTSTPAGFTDNLDEALARAKSEGKLVFACFSGSDWCGPCKALEKEVFSDPAFISGVRDDFVLVFIDFPNDKSVLSAHAKAANKELAKKYGIHGYPTLLVLDGDGKKLSENSGYRGGGAAKYAEQLKEIKKGLQQNASAKEDRLVELEVRIERDGGTLAMPSCKTRVGEACVYKCATEYMYPTKFDVVVVKTNGVYSAVVEPKAFTTREVGVICKATPTLVDGKIDLDFNLEVVGEPEWKNYGGTVTASDGTKSDFPMEQPFFKELSIKQRFLLTPGETMTFKHASMTIGITPKLLTDKKTARQ